MQTKRPAVRPVQDVANTPANEENDEDNDLGLVSGMRSLGIARGRARRSPSPMVIALIKLEIHFFPLSCCYSCAY